MIRIGREGGRKSVFAGYHPLLNFMFFGYAVSVPIFFLHPLLLIISLASALAYSIYLGGRKAALFGLGFVLPVMLLAAAFNPLFFHRGETIIYYFYYNPITLESIIYGLCNATMIGSVILWFTCYNAIMTSDKFIYLFGRLVPAMSLIIAMALRLIPRYQAQVQRIVAARRGIGFDVSTGGYLTRVRNGGEVLSVMVTWALENGIETGDSMLARGYGLPGRTAYSNYRFDSRDRLLLASFLGLMTTDLFCLVTGTLSVQYYSRFMWENIQPFASIALVCHAAVSFLPLALELREDALWRSLRSRI
ncbi:MAG: energy-coupling factor transporter transmembrane protein EcfT [Coriobacteriales bacterium]|jgi:energy-coupling factor transport system permease protein|nr:energy-coupling factor transporter transmembrane protein EcfT [Coriobacteriales bacterium]